MSGLINNKTLTNVPMIANQALGRSVIFIGRYFVNLKILNVR